MEELLLFYLPHCPHCKLAMRCLEQLQKENAAYKAIPIRKIDEGREKALAASYDYWYVPSFWLNGQKLHEGHAEMEDVRAVLDAAAAQQEEEKAAGA